MRAVAFGWGEAADEIAGVQGDLDIAFKPVINEYRGRRSVEMHLVDWRPSCAAVAASR
jgi:single-stranded-DNA-specific exonuclease